MDIIIRQYDLEHELSLSERTKLHRVLITYLSRCRAPNVTDYELTNLTVHAAMQVIFKLQENPDLQEAVIAQEASSLDTHKMRYRLCRTIVRALDVYWRDVRPNFMPNSGLSRRKICFHNAYGDLCFFYTHCFLSIAMATKTSVCDKFPTQKCIERNS